MNEILKKKLLCLLAGTSQVTTQQMQEAYEIFVKEVETFSQSETDFQTIFRRLNITRIEFKTLQTKNLCEQGGKCA